MTTTAGKIKKCGCCKRLLPLDAFWKNKAHPGGITRNCKECHRRQKKEHHERYPERHRERSRRWGIENRERKNAISKRWYEENKTRSAAHNAARRARKKEAELQWSTVVQKEAIDAKYALRDHYNATTGIEHHVDHIWPLKGFPTVFEDFDDKDIDFDLLPEHILILWEDSFRGLHVADNLQVIPATDNLSKSNKRPVDEDGNERPACKWSKTEYDY